MITLKRSSSIAEAVLKPPVLCESINIFSPLKLMKYFSHLGNNYSVEITLTLLIMK